MFSFKLLIAAAALVCVSARHIVLEDKNNYYLLPIEDLEDQEAEELVPTRTGRIRRQAHGSISTNSDGSTSANGMIPIARGESNVLSAIGAVNFDENHRMAGKTAGLSLDNINGHSLTLTHSQLPKADRIAAAANVNLFDNGNHKLDANAFAARIMPAAPQIPNFNTYGAGADYMFKDKVGAGVNVARTPIFDKTDYSAAGKLNLFKTRDSSLDFSAGLSKSVSPFIPKSSWEPNYGLTFKKWF